MERSRRVVMGALLVAMVPALLASSPAIATEHDGPHERAARLAAMVNALSRAARLRAVIDANWRASSRGSPTGRAQGM